MEDEEDHLAECQRDHQEEEAFGAEREDADDGGGEPRSEHGDRQREPHRLSRAFGREEVNDVSGEAVEGAMTEADKARDANEQLQRQREHGRDQRCGAQFDMVGRGEQRQQRECDGTGREREPAKFCFGEKARGFSHQRCPKRPVGRQSSTTAIKT